MLAVSLSSRAESSASIFAKEVEKRIRFVSGTSASKCFLSTGLGVANPLCKGLLASCRDDHDFGVREGRVFHLRLSENLEEEEDPVTMENLWKSTVPVIPGSLMHFARMDIERTFLICKLMSMTGSTFQPPDIQTPEFKDWPSWSQSFLPFDEEDLKTKCSNRPSGATLARLYWLRRQYPNNWTLKFWKETVDENIKRCRELAARVCANAYLLKDEIILSYTTVGCSVREVTEEDVQSDIEQMKRRNETRAAILSQSTLVDTILACRAAAKAEYSWNYVKPKLGDDCVAEGQPKRFKKQDK